MSYRTNTFTMQTRRLPENSKKISLSPLLLSLIVAQFDEAAETTKNISLSFSLTGLNNEEKNCLTSMEQMDLSLSSSA